MSGLCLGYKIGFPKNKQANKSAQHSEGASMTTRLTRGGGNQAQGGKKDEHIDRFKLFLHRGINTVHEFFVYT